MKKDAHAKGQQHSKKSRSDSFIDILFHGGSSPHYNPPKGQGKSYRDGWNNARKNRPKG